MIFIATHHHDSTQFMLSVRVCSWTINFISFHFPFAFHSICLFRFLWRLLRLFPFQLQSNLYIWSSNEFMLFICKRCWKKREFDLLKSINVIENCVCDGSNKGRWRNNRKYISVRFACMYLHIKSHKCIIFQLHKKFVWLNFQGFNFQHSVTICFGHCWQWQ